MIGQTISHYKILEKLGEGGMGIVYKAEDIKLERTVAIKFLPRYIACQVAERERFKIEAKAAAALNHPNIATIHAIEEVDEETFIVMECVEGVELKEKIGGADSRLPVLAINRVIDLATQIAEGLKAAHAKGIIHRDIKSSNIMVIPRERDQVKIMDFGLAKFLEASGRAALLTKSGTTLGTAAYMSPEQARGEPVDQRTDIWSLGIVLYEMISGQLPFQGVYDQAIMYAIVNEAPTPLSRHRAEVSESLQRIVDKALDKDPETRYQHVDDLLVDLQQERKKGFSTSTKFMFAAIVMILAAIMIVSVYMNKRQPSIAIPPTHTQITFVGDAGDPAISSDGQFIAYVRGAEGDQKLMVQDVVGGKPLEIFSGIMCLSPRWSPDGSELAMTATLRDSSRGTFIVPRFGGSLRQLPPPRAKLLCWSSDGSCIAFRDFDDSRERVWFYNKTTNDMASVPLRHSFVAFDWSPLGKRLLFLKMTTQRQFEIWTFKTDGSEQQRVVKDSVLLFTPRWSAHDDAIYYLRSNGHTKDLMKVQISTATGKAQASPKTLQTGLQTGWSLTLSKDNKRALYTRALYHSNLWLVKLEGTDERQIGKPKQLTTGTSPVGESRISSDGKRVAFTIGEQPYVNIFVIPIAGGTTQQLTFWDSDNEGPAWSPDGQEIIFGSNRGGKTRVWRINANGGTPRLFEKSELSPAPFGITWSPGPQILYERDGNRNFHFLDPRTEEERPLVSNDSVGWMFSPRYSPDGKSVALHWNRWEAHKSFRGLWRISLEDSSQILLARGDLYPIEWSADGKWIYYWNPGKKPAEIMMVPAHGGNQTTHAVLPFENVALSYISMTPDGKTIVCTVVENQSDVWLMENFDPEVGKE